MLTNRKRMVGGMAGGAVLEDHYYNEISEKNNATFLLKTTVN